jgi:hypothetical protein
MKQGNEIGVLEQDGRGHMHHNANDPGPAGSQGTGCEIGPVVGLLEDVEHLAPGLLGDRAAVDDPGHGGAGDTTQLG